MTIATPCLLVLLSACGANAPPPLTVSQVWAQHHELDGKRIRVQGVISSCESLDCALRQDRAETSKWLGVGTSSSFDANVQGHLNERIIIEARLRAACLHLFADPAGDPHELIVCSDRASMLLDPKLVR